MASIRFRKLAATLVLSSVAFSLRAQPTGDFMLDGGFDLFKTDMINPVTKFQAGLELNYFVSPKLTISGGVEIWTDASNNNSLAFGARWYPVEPVFFRARALIGQDELSFGAGYAYSLSSKWKLEGIIDYFTEENDVALRVGVGYVISKF